MKQTQIYTPQFDLKEVVMRLAVMIAETNPGFEEQIKEILEEMDKWGKPDKGIYG